MSGINIPGFPSINLPASEMSHSTWMTPVENIFEYMGMTTPFYRLIGVSGGMAVLIYFLKPNAFFAVDEARPWALWSSDQEAVIFPWWLAALLIGLCAATFV